VRDISEHLTEIATKEGIQADADALHVIAQKADGAMRDALSIFDQVVAFCGKNLRYQDVIQNLNVLDYDYYFKIIDFVLNEDIPGALLLYNEVLDKGFDGHHFITGLGAHCRNLLVCKDSQTLALMEVSEGVAEKYRTQAETADLRLLISALDFINTCDIEYRTSKSPRLLVELTLMQLCSILFNRSEGEKKKHRLKPFRSLPPSQKPVRLQIEVPVKAPEPSAPEVSVVLESPLVDSIQTTPPPKPRTASGVVGKSAMSRILSKSKENVSINAIRERQVEEDNRGPAQESIADESGVAGPFDFSHFELAWQEFADSMKGINLSLHATLSKQPHEVDAAGRIQLFLANGVQEIDVINIRSELLGFINERMGMKGFTLNTSLLKHGEIKKTYMTSKDKFEMMAGKNPSLHELRKKFNLNIDF
jgi:DNA polymerase-3 subunit gamma/tau